MPWLVAADSRGTPMDYAKTLAAAFHEAGHAVAAWHYGHFRVDGVSVSDVYPTVGDILGQMDVSASAGLTSGDLWHETAYLMAGGQAETMFAKGNPFSNAEDKVILHGVASQLGYSGSVPKPPWPIIGPLPSDMNATMVMVLATFRAEQILTERADEVKAVADALSKTRRLNHFNLVRLLGPPGQRK